jgi:5-methylcytosine-specific restriction enzyme subunit McrC
MAISTENPYTVPEHYIGPTDIFSEKESYYHEFKFSKVKGDNYCAVLRKSPGEAKSFLETGYYIGVDRFPNSNQCIYVEPKLNKNSESEVKNLVEIDYLRMLIESLNNPELADNLDELFIVKWDEKEIELKNKDDFLTPFLVVQFLGVVKSIVKKGLKKSYYRVEQNLNNRIKGKVLVGQTIKRNHFRQKFLSNVCSYEEFWVNGIENRLLKKTLEFVKPYLHNHSGLMKNGKGLEDLFNFINPAFHQVSSNFDFSELKMIRKNPLYKEYITAIDLAEKILRRFGYNISNCSKKELKSTPPFWIDMSKLFELYVLARLRDDLKSEVIFQFNGKGGNELDFVIGRGENVIIADAKYKPWHKYDWNENMNNDLRQVSGYARLKEVRNKFEIPEDIVPNCLIIYPNLDNGCKTFFSESLLKSQYKNYKNIFKVGITIPLQD